MSPTPLEEIEEIEEIVAVLHLGKITCITLRGHLTPFSVLGAGYTSDLVLRFHVRFAVNRRCDLVHAIPCPGLFCS
jgi:hypothetical protein